MGEVKIAWVILTSESPHILASDKKPKTNIET